MLGVEDLTVDERHYLALQAGVDQFGGNNDKNPVIAAYNMWVEDFGKESADQRFEDSARRLLRNIFNPGLFENPYLDPVESTEIVGNQTFMAEGYDAQVKSVVMLKDTNGAIVPAAEDEKETVYLPKEDNGKYCMNEEIVSKYYDITDNPDEADFAIVAMDAPNGGSGYSQADLEAGGNGYVPITLQYGEYTADTARDPSIAADLVLNLSIRRQAKWSMSMRSTTAVIRARPSRPATTLSWKNSRRPETLWAKNRL